MSRLQEIRRRRQNLSLGETVQLEIPNPSEEEVTLESIERNQRELEIKKRKMEQELEAARKKKEEFDNQCAKIAELRSQREKFLNEQQDLVERLSFSEVAIERDVHEMQQDLEVLEQAKDIFSAHHKKISSINTANWSDERFAQDIEKAFGMIEDAENEYVAATEYFKKKKNANLFGKSKGGKNLSEGFGKQFLQGLAFNLPLILLALVAYAIYLLN